MTDPKHDETFRVVDRRSFTAEGELRPEAAEEKRREEAKPQHGAKSERIAGPAGSSMSSSKASSGTAPASSAAAPAAPADSAAAAKPDKNFQLLVDLLARNAAALMGAIPDPGTGQAYMDLDGAREMIDMLDMLRDKTHGNLAGDEEAMLEEVLGSLKLSYMQISKAAAKAMREGPKGQR
ncbi:MAG TPA: DUF1844 domain-containing protein [Candidatus Acidoferrales bacterium]|nr:DUF1844 domain-containing protein [Candidatus Acidoferrales bacterium]